VAVTVEKRSSTPIRDNTTPFYNVFAGKKWKKKFARGGGHRIAFHLDRHWVHQQLSRLNGIHISIIKVLQGNRRQYIKYNNSILIILGNFRPLRQSEKRESYIPGLYWTLGFTKTHVPLSSMGGKNNKVGTFSQRDVLDLLPLFHTYYISSRILRSRRID
jgi:hypothetical protein